MLSLLIGIDTESDNQWEVGSRAHPTFENIYRLPQLHELFLRTGVRPTYLVTYPVATDPRSADVLRELADAGNAEVGAHHHAWETQPCSPDDIRRHLYASMLPVDQFEAQLERLTEAIERATGSRPLSYRSGRFGFTAAHVSGLEQAGYLVDSSVVPLFYEAHKGGPDFADAPLAPYFLSYDRVTEPGSSQVLEVPVSAALSRRVPSWLARAYGRAPWPYTTRRILRRLGIARVLWLRPSYSSLEEMQALARRIVRTRVPVLNVFFHSSEATPGTSPYNRTQAETDAFLLRLEQLLRFAVGIGARPMTFREFRVAFCRRSALERQPA